MMPRRKSIAQSRQREFVADQQVLGGGPTCQCGAPFSDHEYEGEVFDSPFSCAKTGCRGYKAAIAPASSATEAA